MIPEKEIKRVAKKIALKMWIIFILICYACAWFITTTPNPIDWSMLMRGIFCALIVGFGFMLLMSHDDAVKKIGKRENGDTKSKWQERLEQVQEAQKKAQDAQRS